MSFPKLTSRTETFLGIRWAHAPHRRNEIQEPSGQARLVTLPHSLTWCISFSIYYGFSSCKPLQNHQPFLSVTTASWADRSERLKDFRWLQRFILILAAIPRQSRTTLSVFLWLTVCSPQPKYFTVLPVPWLTCELWTPLKSLRIYELFYSSGSTALFTIFRSLYFSGLFAPFLVYACLSIFAYSRRSACYSHNRCHGAVVW